MKLSHRIHLLTILILLFFQSNNGHTQDSLKTIYSTGFQDTTQINQLITLRNFSGEFTLEHKRIIEKAISFSDSIQFGRGSIFMRFLMAHYNLEKFNEAPNAKLYKTCLDFAQQPEHNNKLRMICSRLGNHYLTIGNTDSAFHYFYLGLDANSSFHNNESWFFTQVGLAFNEIASYDSSIHYFNQAIENSILENDKLSKAEALNALSIVYYRQGNYKQSVSLLLDAQGLYESLQDSFGISLVYNNLANNYKDLKDYNKSLNYYKLSLELYQAFNYNQGIANAYNNIGLIHYHTAQYDSALIMHDKALELRKSLNHKKDIADSYNNIGIVYFEQQKYSNAIEYYNLSKTLHYEVKNKLGLATAYLNLSQVYSKLNDTKKTELFADSALKYIQITEALALEKDLYENLYFFYRDNQSSHKALEYGEKLFTIKEKLLEGEVASHIKALESQKELDQKNKHIEAIEKDKLLQDLTLENQAKTLENEKLIRYSLIGGLVLLISSGLLLFKAYRKNLVINLELQEQQELLQLKNQDILSSKNYANSMEKMLIQQMNPHFIFNALTTVQALINTQTLAEANRFIQTFSSLMRKTLNHSRQDAIPLVEEIEFLELYSEMYVLKNAEKIDLKFTYDEDDVNDFVNTPPMLVQPFIENAFIHGLKHKMNGNKKLSVTIDVKEDFIEWIIEDNGIGREKSASIKKSHKSDSHGTNITKDRIKWMKNIYQQQFSIRYEDLLQENTAVGTKVILTTPIVTDK